MFYHEFGKDNFETIILLHGGGLSWWNFREEARLLQNEYHIILPVLDGHAESDCSFTTIEDNASEIITFIDHKFNGKVLLIGGLSLGAQILLEILSQRSDICQKAIIESAAVIPSKIINALIKPTFGSTYSLIKNKKFAKLQFQTLHMQKKLFEDYYHDTCQIKKDDMISFMKANTSYELKDKICETSASVYIFLGEKENKEIFHSAEVMQKKIPMSQTKVIPDLYHGEFSLNYPEKYVNTIKQIIS